MNIKQRSIISISLIIELLIAIPTIAAIPNDPFYTQQSYLFDTNVHHAWDYTVGSPDIVIAVIDSGVDIDHPDLKDNIWRNTKEIAGNGIDDDFNGYIDDINGWDFVENSPDPRPKFGNSYTYLGMNHGTIISGVIAAKGNNKIGIAGISWNSRIMPLRVLAGDGTGSTDNVAEAIDYARLNGADIINLSFVGQGSSDSLEKAVEKAYRAGIIVIAAAGNEVSHGIDMTSDPRYPVCHDGINGDNWVIGVASTDDNNRLSSFSNYGKCVDIIAPGTKIVSTLYKNDSKPRYDKRYGGYWYGTSVSAPQISGIASLIKSIKPRLNVIELADIILSSATNIDHQNPKLAGKLGVGKIDALKAVITAKNTTSKAESMIDKIIVAPGVGGGPHIRIFEDSDLYSQFFAFDKSKRFGANTAVIDLNQDGLEEIIVSAGAGEEPWVKIFDINGLQKAKFLAYEKNYKNGIEVAAGDIDGDGEYEIITAPSKNYKSNIKIFTQTGQIKHEFQVFNQFFTGGLSITVYDINSDGFDEIIAGNKFGTSPTVKIFNGNGLLLKQFMAYNPGFIGGLSLAAGDIDGDNTPEIITAAGPGGGPHVRIFNFNGRLEDQFFAYNKNFKGGVYVAAGDINSDGIDDIITGPGPGGKPIVKIFKSNGKLLNEFSAYAHGFRGGVKVKSGK